MKHILIISTIFIVGGIIGYYVGYSSTYNQLSKDKIYISEKAKELKELEKQSVRKKEEQQAIEDIKYIFEVKKKLGV